LYGGALLPATQQAELMRLVSQKTGQPIEQTSPDDQLGFGLGVQQQATGSLGNIWLYEGGTAAFRTIHVYVPKSGVILAIGLNSETATPDHIVGLVGTVYQTLVQRGAISGLPAPRHAGRA
jgi:D-alanyl-D-alanine carboxypeptidase